MPEALRALWLMAVFGAVAFCKVINPVLPIRGVILIFGFVGAVLNGAFVHVSPAASVRGLGFRLNHS